MQLCLPTQDIQLTNPCRQKNITKNIQGIQKTNR
jgi:hypothetical protein